MKIEALNCPNCGAGVSSDSVQCHYCRSRLKTMACPSCFGLMFMGSKYCPHCGQLSVQAEHEIEDNIGRCPRCKINLNLLKINEINLRECGQCSGLWVDAATFENICANHENQAAVLGYTTSKDNSVPKSTVSYVPCPDCQQLMNRSNFARSSGIIIDLCKKHGVWFDAEELPKIIEFIRLGGLDHARQKEKIRLEEQMRRLREEQHKLSKENSGLNQSVTTWNSPSTYAVKEIVRFFFD
jgi:Zn-finger nucleic acid-binding protein